MLALAAQLPIMGSYGLLFLRPYILPILLRTEEPARWVAGLLVASGHFRVTEAELLNNLVFGGVGADSEILLSA